MLRNVITKEVLISNTQQLLYSTSIYYSNLRIVIPMTLLTAITSHSDFKKIHNLININIVKRVSGIYYENKFPIKLMSYMPSSW